MKKFSIIKDIKYFFQNNKLSTGMWIGFVALVFLGCYLGITFGRFVATSIKNGIFASNSFYFNCDKMSEDGAVYQLNNWSGADNYSFTFNMNSFKNSLVRSNADIPYTINYSCSDNVLCSSDKDSGIIYYSTNSDTFNITLTPHSVFNNGDEATLNVSATSTSPYVKTISATFTLKVGHMGISYQINDEVNRPYLELRITNTLDYYVVRNAFGEHSVGDRIDASSYTSLSSSDKENCSSSIITLNFNPSNVRLDMTSPAYLKGYSFNESNYDSIDYISSFKFKMDALSSETVTFYKTQINNNYTYPIVNENSIITLTSE